MPLQQILNKISPRIVFLADSLGALLSALLLGLVLARFEGAVGMPQKTLYMLAFIACILSGYSFLQFSGHSVNWRARMKAIAAANFLYCCLTATLLIYHHQQLTTLGLAYFMTELVIVTLLASSELKMALNQHNRKG